VLGPTSVALDKSLFGKRLEILGFLVNLISASLRPKDLALDKLFYVFFNVDTATQIPLAMWQCVASLAEFYSPGLRGMRAFVAPFHLMCRRCGSGPRARTAASPLAAFAIEIWRAVAIMLLCDQECLSVPLSSFILSSSSPCNFELVSDASPWRLAAAVYAPNSKSVLAWSTLLLPFAKGNENKFQVHREYLGHCFSLLLVISYARRIHPAQPSLLYRWINDNEGALTWAANSKCSSQASAFACIAVTQLHLLSNLKVMDTVHLPGVLMGEIDAMSRREIHPDIGKVCPSLTPELYLPLDSTNIVNLFRDCDPARVFPTVRDYHVMFLQVFALIECLIDTL